MAHKRPHTPTTSTNSSDVSSLEHTPKALRITTSTVDVGKPLICELPPTCNSPHKPTYLSDTQEMERHYAMYHAFVCEERGCGAVFPEERFLVLHQTECHDPIAQLRKERGEKTFACYETKCVRKFLTPKARRLHLIEVHQYPKEYFFAITNKGVGGLLKKWGEGASLVRGKWKARDGTILGVEMDGEDDDDDAKDDEDDSSVEEVEHMGSAREVVRPEVIEEVDEEEDEMGPNVIIEEDDSPFSSDTEQPIRPYRQPRQKTRRGSDDNMEHLVNTLDALSLVPPSIQFGRGAKRGVKSGNSRGRGERGRGRGRGHGRGRGRGGQGGEVERNLDNGDGEKMLGSGMRGRGGRGRIIGRAMVIRGMNMRGHHSAGRRL